MPWIMAAADGSVAECATHACSPRPAPPMPSPSAARGPRATLRPARRDGRRAPPRGVGHSRRATTRTHEGRGEGFGIAGGRRGCPAEGGRAWTGGGVATACSGGAARGRRREASRLDAAAERHRGACPSSPEVRIGAAAEPSTAALVPRRWSAWAACARCRMLQEGRTRPAVEDATQRSIPTIVRARSSMPAWMDTRRSPRSPPSGALPRRWWRSGSAARTGSGHPPPHRASPSGRPPAQVSAAAPPQADRVRAHRARRPQRRRRRRTGRAETGGRGTRWCRRRRTRLSSCPCGTPPPAGLLRPRRHGEPDQRAQLDLFGDRTSTAYLASNQLRLWFAAMAYVLLCALRRIGLAHTQFARPPAARCASRCSGSAPRSAGRSAASSSPWPRRIPSRTSSPWPTPDSRRRDSLTTQTLQAAIHPANAAYAAARNSASSPVQIAAPKPTTSAHSTHTGLTAANPDTLVRSSG